MTADLPPAGWYPDPETPSVQRYWDGARWTGHTAPKRLTPSQPPGIAYAGPTPDRGRDNLILAGWITAFFFPPIALVIGITLRRSGRYQHATAMLVVAALMLVLMIIGAVDAYNNSEY